VLVITAILLVLLTILALAAVSMNTTQTRIATNSADSQVAYQTAEAALNQAQAKLLAGSYTAFAGNTAGLYTASTATTPVWLGQNNNSDWWSSAANAIQGTFAGGSTAAGAYVIELLPTVTKPGQNVDAPTQVYRITARGVGASGTSPVVLQSTVQVQ
jgi:type IV pilus assembly protein PilX